METPESKIRDFLLSNAWEKAKDSAKLHLLNEIHRFLLVDLSRILRKHYPNALKGQIKLAARAIAAEDYTLVNTQHTLVRFLILKALQLSGIPYNVKEIHALTHWITPVSKIFSVKGVNYDSISEALCRAEAEISHKFMRSAIGRTDYEELAQRAKPFMATAEIALTSNRQAARTRKAVKDTHFQYAHP